MSGNVHDIISSGILDLYVAGALSPEEISDVERHIERDPEVAAEVVRLRRTLEQYANLHSTRPRPELRARVLGAVEEAQRAEQIAGSHSEPKPTAGSHSEPKPTAGSRSDLKPIVGGLAEDSGRGSNQGGGLDSIQESRTSRRAERMPVVRNRWMLAASIAFVLGLLPGMYYFVQYTGVKSELAQTQVELADAKSAQSVMASKANYMEGALGKLSDTNVVRVAMPGMPTAKSSFATIWWNKGTREVMLDMAKMPDCPAGHDYQLWAIVDGKPVDLGVFNPADTAGTMLTMQAVGEPQVFAVTIEPKGGSPSPTLDKMVVAGSVAKS